MPSPRTSSRPTLVALGVALGLLALGWWARAPRPASTPAPITSSASFAPSLEGGAAGPKALAPPAPAPLAAWQDAVRAATGTPPRPARVLLFGDSHTQGGTFPDRLRERLVERLGDGGPGYLYAGSADHPRRGVKQRSVGLVRSPRAPSSPLRDERVVGLGGVDFAAADAAASVSLEVGSPAELRWDVCVRREGSAGASAAARAEAEGARVELVPGTRGLTHGELTSRPPHALSIRVPRGVALCGVRATAARGASLDAIGINGARLATVTAREEESFVAEVSRAAPDLLVVALGTNETSDDPPRTEDYASDLATLVSRVRRAAPGASCVVVGPTDRVGHEARSSAIESALAEAARRLGCAPWSAIAATGSASSGREDGTFQADGVHLTPNGYRKLADALADDLLREAALDAPPPR